MKLREQNGLLFDEHNNLVTDARGQAIPARRLQAQLQIGGPRCAGPGARGLLGRRGAGILYAVDHPRVLLDALLSGAGAADRVGAGVWE